MYGIKELDVLQLHGMLQESGVALIDVRTPAEVARGGIAGAKNIPLHLIPMVEQELVKQAPVVFYCQTGARSAQACAFMASRGCDNVYNLRGGIMAWLREGQSAAAIPAAV
jgi:rhodanese-related sulfurtransferase